MEVYLSSHVLDSGVVQIDVNVADAPPKLFGVSFHLVGFGGDWELYGHEVGDIFGSAVPLSLVQEVRDDRHETVAGFSLKRGEEGAAHDGTLASFFLVPEGGDEIRLDFESAVASVFEDGRKDLQDVSWKGTAVAGATEAAELADGETDVLGGRAESELVKMAGRGPAALPETQPHPFSDLYLFLGLGFAFVVLISIILMAFANRRRGVNK